MVALVVAQAALNALAAMMLLMLPSLKVGRSTTPRTETSETPLDYKEGLADNPYSSADFQLITAPIQKLTLSQLEVRKQL